MIYDIIALALIVILTIVGVKNGIAKTILNILSAVLTIAASVLAAKFLSGVIFNLFFQNSLTESVTSALKSSDLNDALTAAKSAMSVFPSFLLSVAGYFGVDTTSLENAFAGAVSSEGLAAADNIVAMMRSPVCAVITVILVFILLIIFGILFGFIARKIEKLFHLPIIRGINRLFGGIFGFAEGILCIFALSFIMHLVLPFVTADIFLLSEEYINSSYVFRFIYNGSLNAFIQQAIYDIENIRKAIL